MKELDQLIHERIQVMNWLIDGRGITGVPLNWSLLITPEWICEYFNVDMSYFKL